MTRSAIAVRQFLSRAASAVGLEGTFLAAGTVLLAIGSSFIHPAAPYFVVGGVCLVIGLALAQPRRS